MTRALFIQNGEHDPPGLLAEVLRESGIGLDVIHAWDREPVPTVPNGWAGIAIGGGSISAYEKAAYPFLADEERLIRAASERERPVLGLCLGAQLMAAAFGGEVFPNRAHEIGFQEVRFRPEAESDRLWRGFTAPLRPVHWHGDTFSLPHGAVLLASSDCTENQLFRLGDTHYGLQFHLEIDVPCLTQMVASDEEGWLPAHGVDPEQFLREAAVAIPRAEPVARGVFSRWAAMLR